MRGFWWFLVVLSIVAFVFNVSHRDFGYAAANLIAIAACIFINSKKAQGNDRQD